MAGNISESTSTINEEIYLVTGVTVDGFTDCMGARRDESRFERDVAELVTAGPHHM